MTEVYEPDMVESSFLDDLLVHPAHHLRREGLQRSRVHEHEQAVWMFGMFLGQKIYHLARQGNCPCFGTVFGQFPPFYGALFRYGQRPCFYIQITPFQGNKLALPQSHSQRQGTWGGSPTAPLHPDSPPSPAASTHWR